MSGVWYWVVFDVLRQEKNLYHNTSRAFCLKEKEKKSQNNTANKFLIKLTKILNLISQKLQNPKR